MKRVSAILGLMALAAGTAGAVTISFPSSDGLELDAELYMPFPAEAPFVLLFHMAGSGRGEYRTIAPKLNELGFNALALDQRSGNAAGGVANESARRARAAKLPMGYADALPDMEAALALVRQRYAKGKLILWGSSYSASLVLAMAGGAPSSCDAVLAFSPGEYFSEPGYVAARAKGIAVPAFLTSMRREAGDWRGIFDAIPAAGKVAFVPEAGGVHGSPILEPGASGSAECWEAVLSFLAPFARFPHELKPLAPLYTPAERAALPGVGLFIIDMQAYMMPVVAPERVFPAMLALVEAAERAGSPVAWAYMNELGNGMGSAGFELAAPLAVKPGHLQVLKYSSNAFNGSGIVGMFDRAGVGTVVIGGMSSEGCVDATIAGARKLGYKVIVAEEAHTTGEGGSLENLERMNRVWRRLPGVEVMPAAALRFRAGFPPAVPANHAAR